ncbi:helix-turn-helix domain-containing protein [Yinghuangia aomiensis]|uniref:Helix-turn-helix domain-containing protein n=1 Tax=Yinghuangia aomiensis TaxID=676205 RepID=A0ABP9I817_9ACTN
MERPSPPTRRVAELLDALTDAGDRPLSLAELVRRTGIARATCLGIVNELTASGYLVRNAADRTYCLGPALIAAGRAAERTFPALAGLRPHLAELAREFDAVCTVMATVDEQYIAVLAAVDPVRRFDPAVRDGQRWDYAPPAGIVHAAWDTDDAVERWLARPGLPGIGFDPAQLRAAVAVCRARGYFIERLTRVYTLLDGLSGEEMSPRARGVVESVAATMGERDFLVEGLRDGETYDIGVVSVPVYGPDGRPRLEISLRLMRTGMTPAAIAACADRLRGVAAQATAATGGRDPWSATRPR